MENYDEFMSVLKSCFPHHNSRSMGLKSETKHKIRQSYFGHEKKYLWQRLCDEIMKNLQFTILNEAKNSANIRFIKKIDENSPLEIKHSFANLIS